MPSLPDSEEIDAGTDPEVLMRARQHTVAQLEQGLPCGPPVPAPVCPA